MRGKKKSTAPRLMIKKGDVLKTKGGFDVTIYEPIPGVMLHPWGDPDKNPVRAFHAIIETGNSSIHTMFSEDGAPLVEGDFHEYSIVGCVHQHSPYYLPRSGCISRKHTFEDLKISDRFIVSSGSEYFPDPSLLLYKNSSEWAGVDSVMGVVFKMHPDTIVIRVK